MRTFLAGLLLVLCPIICYPLHFIMWLKGKKDITKRWSMGKKVAGWFFNLELKAAGVKIKVVGEENIPDTPALFVGNHRSYLDILVHHNVIKAPVGFVAKIELAKNILIAPYMKDIGCLFLDRNDIKQGMETINAPGKGVHKGNITVVYGKPFTPSDIPLKERKAKYQELPDIIQALYDANK